MKKLGQQLGGRVRSERFALCIREPLEEGNLVEGEPIDRYCDPSEFGRWKKIGESMGITHVEASPLTRSSYHAKSAAHAVV